jgi:hypothetical protein
MEPQIAFYQLGRKVVSNQQGVPEDARQIMYYSLAIGHHVGVMDCFDELLSVPAEAYRQWLSRLPEGEGRRKLEGVLAFDEIEINRDHVGELKSALDAAVPALSADEKAWTERVVQCLEQIHAEPALYLMVKMCQ